MKNLITWEYALFSANLHHFLPNIPWNSHLKIYHQWKNFHQSKPINTFSNWELGDLSVLLNKEPAILCLFHLGFHGQIPRVLANNGVCFDLILDREVFVKQEKELLKMQKEMQSNGKTYRFLFSDEPNVMLQARSALKQGRHLIVFADGNSGTSNEYLSKLEIKFLNSKIRVRKGIAFLSFFLQKSIIPIAHRNNNGVFKLYAGSIIHPKRSSIRDEYINAAMQQLYGFLELNIVNHPYRWESWNYLQDLNCFDVETLNQEYGSILIHDPSWLLIKLDKLLGYFDRRSYRFIPNA